MNMININLISKIYKATFIILGIWLVYQQGFMTGYDEAKNDLSVSRYNFNESRVAFKSNIDTGKKSFLELKQTKLAGK